MIFKFGFSARRQSNRKAKQAIAKEAYKLVQRGKRVILDTGTTTLELAYLLRDLEDLTVITPSLAVASVLQFSSGIETVLLGGTIRKGSPDLIGVLAESNLDKLAADVAFQGADGIGLDGTLYCSDLLIVSIDQKIRERAQTTVFLVDSSKIGKTSLATNGSINEIDLLITDDKIDPKHRRVFEDMGAKIIVAGEKGK
jgi:DeoR/GlpR family transcriptional regulator of sugar metabolism